ncbi:hypothetical protein BDP81DRAFT_122643 [Colletotrichum phormii]|uniref:Secreted protein n=1 Tax=Colletotrichum phormii TaxID=359342 RepID=A0AAI9ZF98_9PEZI|nr:uncharacterized protein BDP81DRAFT_122643 [Colletotrichum phormii]KAK1623487.1 hypothetical protein BDP81DRAFT_122643 [Colletotrichum phormii]
MMLRRNQPARLLLRVCDLFCLAQIVPHTRQTEQPRHSNAQRRKGRLTAWHLHLWGPTGSACVVQTCFSPADRPRPRFDSVGKILLRKEQRQQQSFRTATCGAGRSSWE